MPRRHDIEGQLRQYRWPNWAPLRRLVGDELVEWFMWMCELSLADGTTVHAYKHVATRRYLRVSDDGRTFAYSTEGRYAEIDMADGIDAVFDGWEGLLPRPDDFRRIRAAIERARGAGGER